MGERELREALRGKAQERIRQIWQAAETAVATRRAAIGAEQAALRGAAEQQAAAAEELTRRNVLAAAELRARQRCLDAEQQVNARLRALADRLLADLVRNDRARLWQALAAALPAAQWQRIRVHPEDLPTAKAAFPSAEVTADPALAGGLVAETADGRIVVDNSLNGRLDRLWPELLAPLFAVINREVDRDAAGSATTD